jgi:putative copper resistance protein D
MDDLGTLLRFLHVLGVAAWLGGMLFLGLVAVPAARALGEEGAGRRVIAAVARRFGALGGAAWILILATGFGLLDRRGLGLGDLPDTDYGKRVLAKLVLLLAAGVAVLLHALWQGPRVRRAEAAGDGTTRRRWALVGAGLDAFMLLATLAALWLAVSLIPT